MVIVEGMISHRAFHHQVEITDEQFDRINLGLAKAASVTLGGLLRDQGGGARPRRRVAPARAPAGALWYLVELLGFVLLPCLLFAVAYRERRLALARVAAVITVVGIMLNRFNVTFIAFNWQLPPDAALRAELDGDLGHRRLHHLRGGGVPLDRQPHADHVRAPGLEGCALRESPDAHAVRLPDPHQGHRIHRRRAVVLVSFVPFWQFLTEREKERRSCVLDGAR